MTDIDKLREALEQIAKPKYGLQGIIEDYSDANAFNYHAMTYWRDLAQSYEATARATLATTPAETFQNRVQPWMTACFGPEISGDRLERADRLLEEVLELLQSGDYPRERIAALTGYVWSRPKGEPAQEVGGVMVTLTAYCLAHSLDMHEAGETELTRIWTKVEKIRAKQAAKPTGSALPQAWPEQPAPADRGSLVKLIRETVSAWCRHPSIANTSHHAIADALLARGLRLPGGDETMALAAKIILSQQKRPGSPVADAFTVACAHLEDRECGAETTNEIIETFLKTLAGEDN